MLHLVEHLDVQHVSSVYPWIKIVMKIMSLISVGEVFHEIYMTEIGPRQMVQPVA